MGRWSSVIASALVLAACQPYSQANARAASASRGQPASTPTTSSSPTSGTYNQRCPAEQLTISWGGGVSEPTGQNTLPLVITNTSTAGCYFFGYPSVIFKDSAGRVLPFQYARSGDQVVTAAAPTHVDVAPGASAYVTINKYRCDMADLMSASDIILTPPAETSSITVAMGDHAGMDYCGPGDPGSIIHVSPVEPTYQATWAAP